jgi:hypothetical protein
VNRRALTSRLLSPFALSNTAIVLSVLIGAVGVVAFVPEQGAALREWRTWVLLAIVAEAAFTAVMLALRTVGAQPGPMRVALALGSAGAARGVVIAVGTHAAGLHVVAAGDVVGRAANSVVFCLFGGALIGVTLAWRQDFRDQYRALVERALLIERTGREDGAIDQEVLIAWASIKAELDETVRHASSILASTPREEGLNAAAELLTTAVDAQLRPASRAMWEGALPDRPPISTRTLFVAALAAWQLPLRTVLTFFAVLVGIGSIVRVGTVPGLWFTLEYLVVTGAVLGLSVLAARVWPAHTTVIAVGTLVALPALLLASIILIADPLLGLEADRLSEVIVAVQAPITTILIAMAVEAGRQRQRILDALQARVDADAIGLLAQVGGAHDDAQRLSVFMHHSVQSEFAALAMQLREAALTHESSTMSSVSSTVLMRLGAIENLETSVPPWLKQSIGYERIGEIVSAWTGVLDVQVSLPAADACRRHQWLVATQVIEEGLANAARHGNASRVVIVGRVDDACLTLSIEDDGSQMPGAGSAAGTGLGMQWLERIAPGDWDLRHSAAGSTLVVMIR